MKTRLKSNYHNSEDEKLKSFKDDRTIILIILILTVLLVLFQSI